VPFASWGDFLAESEHNAEFKRAIGILQNPNWYAMLKEISTHRNTHDPDIILTTAHKSKGLEWDIVVLADDYPQIYDKEGVYTGLDQESANILYVAATRAKKVLFINNTIDQILNYKGSE
jgi:superfamily I DNA/RNA helicase